MSSNSLINWGNISWIKGKVGHRVLSKKEEEITIKGNASATLYSNIRISYSDPLIICNLHGFLSIYFPSFVSSWSNYWSIHFYTFSHNYLLFIPRKNNSNIQFYRFIVWQALFLKIMSAEEIIVILLQQFHISTDDLMMWVSFSICTMESNKD